MKEDVCFVINDKYLYAEKVLVDYNCIPLWFLCIDDDEQYYTVLCYDLKRLNYIVTVSTRDEIHDLLCGKKPMRSCFTKKEKYWDIITHSDRIDSDDVIEHNIKDLDISLLPEEKSFFHPLTKDMDDYVKKFA